MVPSWTMHEHIVATTNILADTLGYRSEATGRVGTYRTIASVVTDYIQKNSSATSGSALPSETESDTEDTTASGEIAIRQEYRSMNKISVIGHTV